jgi:hypothetical protein
MTTTAAPDIEAIGLEDLVPYENNEDPDLRTHIISPAGNEHIWQDGMTAQDVVDLARMTQQDIVAICGYRFTPKHDPMKNEMCSRCAELFYKMP